MFELVLIISSQLALLLQHIEDNRNLPVLHDAMAIEDYKLFRGVKVLD
jgi:hypothetical protein